jgi:hypothetical protein
VVNNRERIGAITRLEQYHTTKRALLYSVYARAMVRGELIDIVIRNQTLLVTQS